ncbi:PP0621 family protein [Pseudomonas sp. NY15181]|uniref:PP0621 family protein n=1 Tax=Pseudomonas sp. NY15181 TaxID=3400349 RepID=UPI003A84FC98
MTRLLFWILLFALGWWLWRKATRPARPSEPAPREEKTVPMVRCAQCGVHVPRSDALQDESNWYCSRAHLDQDRADRGH